MCRSYASVVSPFFIDIKRSSMSRTGEYYLEVEQYMREEQNIIEFEMHTIEVAFEKLTNIIKDILTKRGYKKEEIRCNLQSNPLSVNLRYDYWNQIDDQTLKIIEQETGVHPEHWEDFDEDTGYINSYRLTMEAV